MSYNVDDCFLDTRYYRTHIFPHDSPIVSVIFHINKDT